MGIKSFSTWGRSGDPRTITLGVLSPTREWDESTWEWKGSSTWERTTNPLSTEERERTTNPFSTEERERTTNQVSEPTALCIKCNVAEAK